MKGYKCDKCERWLPDAPHVTLHGDMITNVGKVKYQHFTEYLFCKECYNGEEIRFSLRNFSQFLGKDLLEGIRGIRQQKWVLMISRM